MIIVRVIEEKADDTSGSLFNKFNEKFGLNMDIEPDRNIYNVIVDGKNVLTLHSGSESEMDLPIGKHAVHLEEARPEVTSSFLKFLNGPITKSNTLQVNVTSIEDDITIEAAEEYGDIKASLLFGQNQAKYATVNCGGCGAPNRVFIGRSKNCEYCDKPLNVPDE